MLLSIGLVNFHLLKLSEITPMAERTHAARVLDSLKRYQRKRLILDLAHLFLSTRTPFYVPRADTSHLANDPLRRLMSNADVDPHFKF